MSAEESLPEEVAAAEAEPTTEAATVDISDAPDWSRDMPPITRDSRFLYVDVAARRAKQLRRGALPRLEALAPDPETGERPATVAKLERIAMEEVDEGLIAYALPDEQEAPAEEA